MAKEKAEEAQSAEPKPKKKLPMTIILIVVVAGMQGAGFYVGAKYFGAGPSVAHGETEDSHHMEGHEPEPDQAADSTVEISLLKSFKVPNNKSGRMYIYDLDIVAKLRTSQKAAVEKLVAERPGEISDAVARIVRSAEPKIMAEDELKSLRMQIRSALAEIAGEAETFEQVLIPRCVPIRVE